MREIKVDNPILIPGGIQLLSKSEILDYIPEETYNKIKAEDPNPMFIMMTIGHEGEAKGELFEGSLDQGKKMSHWYKQLWPLKAVKELVSLIKSNKYTPVFEAHAVGPMAKTRSVVGNIIVGTKKVIDGITHAVGIAYINNYGTRKRIESGEFDACSLEANCMFEAAENIFHYITRKVLELSGVALCNSNINPPGFNDANIMAVVTAMAKKEATTINEEKGDKQMTLQEIKNWLREQGITADKIFTIEELTKVPTVVDASENEQKKVLDDKDKEIKELNEKLAPHLANAAQSKVAELVRKSELLKDEYKTAVDYLAKTVRVDITDSDKPQELVDAAIKAQLELMKSAEFKTKAAEAAIEEEKKTKAKKEQEEEEENANPDDMTDEKNNPLIPGSTAKKEATEKKE